MKKLLIIVDMINGFITQGNLHDKGISEIIPACLAQVKSFIADGQEIIAFCDQHEIDSLEFQTFPVHCLAGTEESELVEQFNEYREHFRIIPKNSTNGFFAEGFKEYLDKLADYQEIVLVGCCTDICVLQLGLSLRAYCNEMGYNCAIVVDQAACDTFDLKGHPRDKFNDLSFELMQGSGIKIIRGAE